MRVLIILLSCLSIEMVLAQEHYVNPIDGHKYIADWETYTAAGTNTASDGRVEIEEIRFLNTQAEFEKNTSAKELANLIGYILFILSNESKRYNAGGEVLLQIEIKQNSKPQFTMNYRGDLQREHLKGFYDALSSIEIKSKAKPLKFLIHFRVKDA